MDTIDATVADDKPSTSLPSSPRPSLSSTSPVPPLTTTTTTTTTTITTITTTSLPVAIPSSNPTPPSPIIPLPPPPPPPPPPPAQSAPDIKPFLGPFDSFVRSGRNQLKWLLILVTSSIHTAPLPLHDEQYHDVATRVLLWRRHSKSFDIQSYSSFYPVDTHPHLAILDPRTGERLLTYDVDDASVEEIWADFVVFLATDFLPRHPLRLIRIGNVVAKKVQGKSVQGGSEEKEESKEKQEEKEGDDNQEKEKIEEEEEEENLGPLFYKEKSKATSTRRVSATAAASQRQSTLQPTSIMDDEEAAIAAAIAASLKDVDEAAADSFSDPDDDIDDEDDEHNDSTATDTDMSPVVADTLAEPAVVERIDSDVVMTSEGETAQAAKQKAEEDNLDDDTNTNDEDDDEEDSNSNEDDISIHSATIVPTSAPGTIPTPPVAVNNNNNSMKNKEAGPSLKQMASSVDSLSSSYIGRVESCLKSVNDPQLSETRALIRKQDRELQAALDVDRAREHSALLLRQAAHRLAHVYIQGDLNVDVLLRLPDGKRVVHALPRNAPLAALRDVVSVETSAVVPDTVQVNQLLASRQAAISTSTKWADSLSTLDERMGARVAFFVNSL